jgi:hypothetical protein
MPGAGPSNVRYDGDSVKVRKYLDELERGPVHSYCERCDACARFESHKLVGPSLHDEESYV